MKRRRVLQLGAAFGGGLLANKSASASELGRPLGPYGERSRFEKSVRFTRQSKTPEAGASFTPLAESNGILTPSALHYERHHAGIPDIDPARHRLVIEGMVERPLLLTVDEIKRLPSVSRGFCSSNAVATAAVSGPQEPGPTYSGAMVWRAAANGPAYRCGCSSRRSA